MKEEIIKWDSIIMVPDPDTVLTIFLHIIVHFWRAENDTDYYKTYSFPQNIEDVFLRVDHQMYKKTRYHLYEVDNEYIGIWDETPFHVDLRSNNRKSNVFSLDHNDHRHDLQLFLRSFLKYIKDYPSLEHLYKLLSNFPLLQWKCNVCCLYNNFSRRFIETLLLEKNISIAPSSLLYLLTFSNKKMGVVADGLTTQMKQLHGLLVSALRRFFINFEKIYEQTSTDPIVILDQFITILEKYTAVYTTDQVHEFENQCAREMKNYLYEKFKFLQTKTIQIHHFPRDMMIIRDIFAMIVGVWSASSQSNKDASPGVLILLCNMLFEDKALNKMEKTPPLVVFHPLSQQTPIIRHMTPNEVSVFTDYHPLLRHTIFQKEE